MLVRLFRKDSCIWVKPTTDIILFMHCSGGLKEVTKKIFNDIVEPLLWVHNVRTIDFNG